jgi:ABC-type transport system substrate-binding protein
VFGDEFAWVTNKNDETVTRIDPLTGAKHTFRVGSSPNAVVVDPNGKLVVVTGDHVADPMVGLAGRKIATFLLQFDVFHPDPVMSASDMGGPGASVHKAIGLNLTRMAYDPQPHLVLDAASRFATSLDGRTFTFTIRPGLRFSPPSGKPVTAETFRLSLERALSAAFQSDEEQATFGYLRDVVGARAFHTGKSDHVAGISARGDQLTIRLERAGSDLPIALTLPMFQAVPDGTGAPAGGAREPLPSAGPFYVSAYEPGRHLVLRANPNYHGNRKRSLDAVVFRIAWSPSLAVDQVVKGKADGVAVDPDGVMDVRSTIAHRYAAATRGQPHWSIGAYPGIAFLQFNTTRGPFRDVALRRAVNRAIDRKAFADQTDQVPLDSLVAPGTPGYEPRPIARPDRAALDRLLGGKTLAVTMYYDADPEQRGIARVVSAQLEHIGIHVTAKAVGSPSVTARAVADRPDEAFDLRLDHWWMEVIDVGNTVNNLVDPTHERYPLPQLFRNAEWNRLVRDARRRTGNEREQTYKRLAARLVDEQAPVAVLSAWTEPELTSARLGCVVPTHWLDLEQLCLN